MNQRKKQSKDFTKLYSTVVIFNANWNDSCYHTYSLWVKLAAKFSTQFLQFAELNVSDLENVARNYKVSTSGIAGHLPALILFEDG